MTDINAQTLDMLKSDAENALKQIDMSKPLTKEQFFWVGSSLAILNHGAGKNIDNENDMYSNHELMRKIKSELDGAEEYLTDYRITNDRDYIQMAADEASHARKLIKVAEKYGYDVKCKWDWLMDLEERLMKVSQ